ncbi:MAG: methyltransferase domain-containing protein, partial [Calditrichaeota bacterium]|nr:methyltransferase domain-containing protein [Calditrichota bacterium]
MSTFLLKILNKEAQSPKNHPDEIIKNLGIEKGNYIADIGSGGGFFSFEFAKRVGESGRVYAVDTNRKYLDYIQKLAERSGI